jgi:hypothetical protein
VRGLQTEFKYARDVQPTPKFGEWVEPLIEILGIESKETCARARNLLAVASM